MFGLTPIKHRDVRAFVRNNKNLIAKMLAGYSSPLHIIFPQVFAENVDNFRGVFSSHGLEECIFFACKSNKSNAFIETAAHKGIGVEVSSYYELQNTLGRGIQGQMIIAGGPGKTKQFLLLALASGAIISVDSKTELVNILWLCRKSGLHARILLRIGNVVDRSRFGIGIPIDDEVLSLIISNIKAVEVRGFSGHLNNYDLDDRIKLIMTYLELCKQFRRLGCVNCNIINIGGGFTMSYTTKEEWKRFDKNKEEFWNDKTFEHFYPYYSKLSGSDGLKYILEHFEGEKRLCELLKDGGHKLVVEPGEALLNQAGITVMRITDVKALEKGQVIVVDGNINYLSERLNDEDFLLSPDLISFKKLGKPFEGYVAGNSCMEEDMISWHKIRFDNTPVVGDILVFYNTAGYLMDSNESNFMRIPIPKKVCAFRRRGKWETCDDKSFTQVELLEESV